MAWQIIISVVLTAAIFFLSFTLEAGGMGFISHMNALMIVLGGTVCAALMTYPLKKLVWTFQVLRKAVNRREKDDGVIQAVVHLARNYRRGWNIRHLEQQAKDFPPGLLKSGVELIAYQYDREKIKKLLRQEASCIQGQYESAGRILQNLSQILPSMGLIGTIVNFIRFSGLAVDIQGLGGYAAVTFLSTLYGILLAKFSLVPLADRLKEFMAEEAFRMDLIQEGILGIRDQEHPRAIQFKLESRLAARETLSQVPESPEVVLLPPEEMGLEENRVGSILVN